MVFKVENTTLVINGRSVVRGLITAHIIVGLWRAVRRAERECYDSLNKELKKMKKEQKLSAKKEKKQKVESK